MSLILMKILGVFFLILAVISAWERNYPRALFYLSSTGIQVALIWGIR